MFVIDRIVLQSLDQISKIVRLGNKNSVFADQFSDIFQDLVDILNVGKDIGGGHQSWFSIQMFYLEDRFPIEKSHEGRYSLFFGYLCCKRRLNPCYSVSSLGKVF